ncbi:MAG: pitrilysin family protein [Helicobacter sp.]|nr:pitrilysin family protein [Helicobacter sp.]
MKRILIIFATLLSLVMANTNNINNEKSEGLDYVIVKKHKIPVIFEENNLIPQGYVRFVFIGGGSLSDGKLPGLADISADLLNEGTKSMGVAKFYETLDAKAVSLSVGAGSNTLNFRTSFLKEYEDLALGFLKNLMLDPNYTDNTLQKIRQNALNDLLAQENNFDYLGGKFLTTTLFAGTPLANYPTKDSINKIRLSDIKSHLTKTMVLENLVIVAGGDMQKKAFFKKLEGIISNFRSGKKAPTYKFTASSKAETKSEFVPTLQAYIYFGAPFNTENIRKDSAKTTVLSYILGSGFGSRITEEIRVKKGLAYSAFMSVSLSPMVSYASGHLQTKLKNQDEAIKLVKEVVANFVKNGITKEELEGAKKFLLGSEPLREERLSQRLGAKFDSFYLGLPLDFSKTRLKEIEALSLGEINAFIKSHNELNKLTFSIITQRDPVPKDAKNGGKNE